MGRSGDGKRNNLLGWPKAEKKEKENLEVKVISIYNLADVGI